MRNARETSGDCYFRTPGPRGAGGRATAGKTHAGQTGDRRAECYVPAHRRIRRQTYSGRPRHKHRGASRNTHTRREFQHLPFTRKASRALGGDATGPFTLRTHTFMDPGGSLKHHSVCPAHRSVRAGCHSESGAVLPSGRRTSTSLYCMTASGGVGVPLGRVPGVMTRSPLH